MITLQCTLGSFLLWDWACNCGGGTLEGQLWDKVRQRQEGGVVWNEV